MKSIGYARRPLGEHINGSHLIHRAEGMWCSSMTKPTIPGLDLDALRDRLNSRVSTARGSKSKGKDAEAMALDAVERTRAVLDRAMANLILVRLPDLIATAISDGKTDVVVISTDASESHGADRRLDSLTGIPKLVVEGCEKLGLKVSLVYDYDNDGKNSWHNVVVTGW